jgi:hypothetical protein
MQQTNEERGGENGSRAGHIAHDLGEKAAEQARSVAELGKAKLASQAEGVAGALRHASEGLRSDEHQELARYTEEIADKLGRVAGAIKDRDVASIVSDVTRFARRQPALFLGGAFTAGLFAARFLKSSSGSGNLGGGSRASHSSFDTGQRSGPPPAAGMGDWRDDDLLLDQVSAPEGFGPAPGGYGPASAPAGAHGGTGTFGAEGAGGGFGNRPEGSKDATGGRP